MAKLPHGGVSRPHNANRPTRNDGLEFRGDDYSRIVAYCKTGSSEQRDTLRKVFHHLGLDAQFIPDGVPCDVASVRPLKYRNGNGMTTAYVGHLAAFDVAGTKEALLALIDSGLLAAPGGKETSPWHYVTTTRVGVTCVGSGPEKRIAPRFTTKEVDAIASRDLLGLDDMRHTPPMDNSKPSKPKQHTGANAVKAVVCGGESTDYVIGG